MRLRTRLSSVLTLLSVTAVSLTACNFLGDTELAEPITTLPDDAASDVVDATGETVGDVDPDTTDTVDVMTDAEIRDVPEDVSGDPDEDVSGDSDQDSSEGDADASCPDGDSDGVCDADDICPAGPDDLDDDADGVPDDCDVCDGHRDDEDDDDDDVPDGCDACPGGDDSEDEDGDEIPDACDCDDADICHADAFCTPSDGEVECTCYEGYDGNGIDSCEDINECTGDPCAQNTECENNEGGFICRCIAGYESDNPRTTDCTDINECLGDPCAANTECENSDATFSCECLSGYESANPLTTDCTDINECLGDPCAANTECENSDATFLCECITGYESADPLTTDCTDINECLGDPCAANTECENSDATFSCECITGYESADPVTTDCTDINECLGDPCAANTECENSDATFSCECITGYESANPVTTDCTDINECLGDPCAANTECENSDATFSCECITGYESDDPVTTDCTDINECLADPCAANTECENSDATFSCECITGYESDDPVTTDCTDINECLADPCAANTECENSDATFSCECIDGYESDNPLTTDCTDINECDDGPGCAANAECDNQVPGFDCECTTGYESVNPVTTDCTDINECAAESDNCDDFASCDGLTPAGSFTCSCPEGHTGAGTTEDPCMAVVTVTIEGTGGGSVLNASEDIICTTATSPCSLSFASGSDVTLTAIEMVGSGFDGWTFTGCEATGAQCEISLDSSPLTPTVSFTHQTNLIFATEGTIAPGGLGATGAAALVAADAFCQSEAERAGLPGTYMSWLSTSEVDAIDRIRAAGSQEPRGWVRMDGRAFTDSLDGLVTPVIYYPVRFNQFGEETNKSYLTGTRPDGSAQDHTCGDYTDADQSARGGDPTNAGIGWTASWGGGCSTNKRLVCMGIDLAQPITPVTFEGRRVFLSRTKLLMSGPDEPDRICADEAAESDLTGTFRALVAVGSEGIAEHVFGATEGVIDYPSGPWITPDGRLVSDADDGLFVGETIAAISVDAAGNFSAENTFAWTGGSGSDAEFGAGDNCADWSDPSGDTTGKAGVASSILVSDRMIRNNLGCNPNDYPVFCAEIPCGVRVCAENAVCGEDETCMCPEGWFSDAPQFETCEFDECLAGTDNCEDYATCDGLSPAGSFTCTDRVEGDSCNSPDECPEDVSICSTDLICQNGDEGDDCDGHDDCGADFHCGTTGSCESGAPLELASPCSINAECRSLNCYDEHCTPEGFVYIPRGTFCMGSPGGGGSDECPDDGTPEPGRDADEGPLHEVTLSAGFLMQQTEVTQEQWSALFAANPSRFDECGDTCPVEMVNWWEAVAYMNALSVAEGLEPCYGFEGECDTANAGTDIDCSGVDIGDPNASGDPYQCEGYRLPTEAEWEFANRAGTATAFYSGSITNTGKEPLDPNLDEIGWYGGNSDASYANATNCSSWFSGATTCGTQPVAGKSPNSLGLYDMSGNVWEWVWDLYDDYQASPTTDPAGGSGTDRSIRGGAWFTDASFSRAAERGYGVPGDPYFHIGMRPVRSIVPPHCSDGVKNESETDVDCGGDCGVCALAAACSTDGDCSTRNCSNDRCAPEGFAAIPAGTFCMGSPGGGGSDECPDSTAELGRNDDEGPMHQVTLTRAFYLETTEVTQAQWSAYFPDNNPSSFDECTLDGSDCPVDTVNWWEAVAYLNARSVSEGLEPCYTLEGCDPSLAGTDIECSGVEVSDARASGNPYLCEGYRLPMEAEWEYAYRAGTTTAFYSGGITETGLSVLDPNLDPIGWYGANSGVTYEPGYNCSSWNTSGVCGTHEVGTKEANAWGLDDMSGNVTEWVWDGHEAFTSAPVADPLGGSDSDRVYRGGGWSLYIQDCRASTRWSAEPGHAVDVSGIRAARTLFPAHCSDDEISGSETDVDCGGDCQPCLLAAACTGDDDCATEHCSNDHCAPDGFAYIPAGAFCMGSPGDGGTAECPDGTAELGRLPWGESPLHQVTLTRAFFLQETEVTRGQWTDHFPDNDPTYSGCGFNCPVDRANWWEAAAYLNALSLSEGLEPCYSLADCDPSQAGTGIDCSDIAVSDPGASGNPYDCEGYRLPMEAEWEYAYRAGTTTAFHNGGITNTDYSPLDEGLDAIGWYGGNSEESNGRNNCSDWYDGATVCGTHAVGGKLANDWGVYDMSGNVSEWVWDAYDSNYYASSPLEDPAGGLGSKRIGRGGSWASRTQHCRGATRSELSPGVESSNVGFRPARTVP